MESGFAPRLRHPEAAADTLSTATDGPRVRILLLGDVCAEPGRKAVEQSVSGLKQRLGVDFVIANAENAAAGYGITPRLAEGLLRAGVDCLTTGDHVYDRKEAWDYLGAERRILRPLNYPPDAPGRGFGMYECAGVRVGVISLLGRVFLKPLDCPFRRVLPVVNDMSKETPVIVVDFHAEATAEKQALGWYLDGKVSAVLGTHTHVQTGDERVLPAGTGFITDVGMCGSFDSVLGMSKELSLRRMIDMVPVRLHPATDDVRLNGVIVDVDISTGQTVGITRLAESVHLPPNQTAAPNV